ncbi:hypothetical protein BV25DRAFT_1991903 [Artomyces pyxidatus]|uniref:Uncharacterized protein n=1 Tax=Artomyces pyxidatus TaxID=48021 RepID=A0ACB8SZL9_9AGAM|nr:hypothetical protein BV25DRAFT_1991903 [Artomyces pyxidatus]
MIPFLYAIVLAVLPLLPIFRKSNFRISDINFNFLSTAWHPEPAFVSPTETYLFIEDSAKSGGGNLFPIISGPHCVDDAFAPMCFAVVDGLEDDAISEPEAQPIPSLWDTISTPLMLKFSEVAIVLTLVFAVFAHLFTARQWPTLMDRISTAISIYWNYSSGAVSSVFLQDVLLDLYRFWMEDSVPPETASGTSDDSLQPMFGPTILVTAEIEAAAVTEDENPASRLSPLSMPGALRPLLSPSTSLDLSPVSLATGDAHRHIRVPSSLPMNRRISDQPVRASVPRLLPLNALSLSDHHATDPASSPLPSDVPAVVTRIAGFTIGTDGTSQSCGNDVNARDSSLDLAHITSSRSVGRKPSFLAMSLQDLYAKPPKAGFTSTAPTLAPPFREACKKVFPTVKPTQTQPAQRRIARAPSAPRQRIRHRRFRSDGVQVRDSRCYLGPGDQERCVSGLSALDPAKIDPTCAFAVISAERVEKLEREAVAWDPSWKPFKIALPVQQSASAGDDSSSELVVADTAAKESSVAVPIQGALGEKPDLSIVGIIITDEGNRVVPSNPRPDASMRREIKIRPGYAPQESFTKYRPPPAREAHARASSESPLSSLWRSRSASPSASLFPRFQMSVDSPSRKADNWRSTTNTAVSSPTAADDVKAADSPITPAIVEMAPVPKEMNLSLSLSRRPGANSLNLRKPSHDPFRSNVNACTPKGAAVRPRLSAPALDVLKAHVNPQPLRRPGRTSTGGFGTKVWGNDALTPSEELKRRRVRTASARALENVGATGHCDKSGQIVLPAGTGWKGRSPARGSPRQRQPTAAPQGWAGQS